KFEEDSGAQPDDITRTPPVYPCSRSSRLQQLMRGDEGYLLALVDRALQAPEYGEHATGPAQDEEFVLAHADNVEAAGFVSHLKLPHYVDFQAELELLKRLQQEQNHG
ncbi:hypothetical protein CIV86_004852, partial [Escherichia coli]|nr:hypothetical protein [Escherichia coli]